jgi:hypothetical protein
VYFGSFDTFDDTEGKVFKPGTSVPGIRVYHRRDEEMGAYEVNLEDLKHPFRDVRKGLFVPFQGDGNTHYFAMVLRKGKPAHRLRICCR